MADIVEYISTVGFPIVACLVMYSLNERQQERFLDEISKLRDVINNNTSLIQIIVDRLSHD